MKKTFTIFAPATIANLGSGFDLLGLAIDGIGDKLTFIQRDNPGVTITKIEGFELSYENDKNIVGYVAEMMLKDANADFGVDLKLFKGIKPGSGIGSSAASSVATAYGINKLLGGMFNNTKLLEYAMEGELLVSGGKFADNVAPCLLGGMVLINDYEPLSYMQLPVPENMFTVVLHPQIEIKTSEAREILPFQVDMKDAIKQAKNLGTLIAGLYTQDLSKITKGLEDRLATPYRSKLIPYFDELKQIGLDHNAIGSGISGSGPSVFYLCSDKNNADEVEKAVLDFYKTKDIEFKIYNSPVARIGAREIT
ncbi:MAG: homoserine kinase [Glaciecola sp.]|jgi:homoserine kinase